MATSIADPSNAEQLKAWDGDEGAYWAANADRFDRSITAHHERLMAAAAVTDGDRVLDVGCGTGQTTRDAGRATPSGSALGVDLSSAMLEVARERAAGEGLANVGFEQADAQIHPFEAGAFDVALSRTGAMFFADLEVAFANVGRALRAGGRLALITWQPLSENEWMREINGALDAGRGLPGPPPNAGPFSLSDPERLRAILEAGGFTDVACDPVAAPMWFGADAADARDFVLGLMGWRLEGLDEAGRRRAVDDLHEAMAAHETPDGVQFASGSWLTTATRA